MRERQPCQRQPQPSPRQLSAQGFQRRKFASMRLSGLLALFRVELRAEQVVARDRRHELAAIVAPRRDVIADAPAFSA